MRCPYVVESATGLSCFGRHYPKNENQSCQNETINDRIEYLIKVICGVYAWLPTLDQSARLQPVVIQVQQHVATALTDQEALSHASRRDIVDLRHLKHCAPCSDNSYKIRPQRISGFCHLPQN
jgi:hypothetical protein